MTREARRMDSGRVQKREPIRPASRSAARTGRNLGSTAAIAAILLVFAIVMGVVGADFASMHNPDVIVKGPGVTRVGRLSDYLASLAGTPGDTDVYFLEGAEPGGTVLCLGGVHPNEIAGIVASVLLVENTLVEKGRLIVIPHSNASGLTYSAPREAAPYGITIRTDWGERRFRYGDRLTSPLHQYPDPEVYVHYPSGQLLSGFEVRNLDRAFPGRPDGMLTERVAYGITELVRKERAGLVIDLHEARPMNPIVNCIITHERAMTLSSIVAMNLEAFEKIPMRLEPSPKNMHGLSHREIGDFTDALSVLMETPNPAMDWLRGPTSERLIVEGKDVFYARAAERGLIYVPYPEEGLPLAGRVGRHTSAVAELLATYSELYPDVAIQVEGIPSHADVVRNGIGPYLLKP